MVKKSKAELEEQAGKPKKLTKKARAWFPFKPPKGKTKPKKRRIR